MSGGAATAPHVAVRAEPLSLDTLVAAVRDPRAGAVVTFSGVTRDVDHLDYEAYAEMAAEQIEAIVAAAIERHGLCAAAAEHRVGRVPRSEASVIVAASAPHRAEAFAGAREIIDEIKRRAPIWKREEGDWVAGQRRRPAVLAGPLPFGVAKSSGSGGTSSSRTRKVTRPSSTWASRTLSSRKPATWGSR